jgi:hypothetical protein
MHSIQSSSASEKKSFRSQWLDRFLKIYLYLIAF